jgi:hemin uptake protein HemP
MHPELPDPSATIPSFTPPSLTPAEPVALPRLKSSDLFRHGREIEIDHNGRIYRMRLTHLNKLILTA